MQLGPHVAALSRFAESHLTGGDDDAFIRLKLDHSMRVLDNAETILAGEGITGHDADLCRLAALYHDMGRFPQFAAYRTFNDRESVNHARLGVLALRAADLPAGLSTHDWRVVRFTVAQHNAKTVRPTLPPRLAAPVAVVRDADKLDIFRILLDHFEGNGVHGEPVTFCLDDSPDRYSDEVYRAVMEYRTGDYRHLRYTNDFKLLLAGWLYELRHATSLALAVERDYPARLFARLPDDAGIRRLRDAVYSVIRYNS
jgi:hypothetical protein